MGKTLVAIAEIGIAAAAIAVGQPEIAAFIGSSTLATAAVSTAIALGLQGATSLLGLGPSGPKPETTETAIKTSRPPRVSGYGRSRLYGAIALPCFPDGTIDIGIAGR